MLYLAVLWTKQTAFIATNIIKPLLCNMFIRITMDTHSIYTKLLQADCYHGHPPDLVVTVFVRLRTVDTDGAMFRGFWRLRRFRTMRTLRLVLHRVIFCRDTEQIDLESRKHTNALRTMDLCVHADIRFYNSTGGSY